MTMDRIYKARTLACLFALLATASLILASGAAAYVPTDSPPSVWSDKDDYRPGERVTLSGAHWAPGESVHLYVNDDEGRSWSRDADVTADAEGVITDEFTLPDWFVARYSVKATGASGSVATTSFTDGNLGVTSAPVATGANEIKFSLIPRVHSAPNPTSNNDCTSNADDSAMPSAVVGSTTTGNAKNNWTLGVDAKDSVRLEAAASASQPAGWTFKEWTGPAGSFFVIDPANPRVICVTGNFGGSRDFQAVYQPQAPTTLSATPAAGTYGGTTSVSARLTTGGSGGAAVAGKKVSFTLNGTAVCDGATGVPCPTTNASGVAALSGVSLAGIDAGTYVTGLRASFAGDGTHLASAATNTLAVDEKPVTGSFTAADKVYDGTATATITGRSLNGAVGADDVSLSGGSASFDDKNAGTGKPVTGNGFTLAGAKKDNYVLSSVSGTHADITRKGLSIAGAVASDKTYDGTSAASVSFAAASLSGAVSGDAVSIDASGHQAHFDSKDVGTARSVTVTGVGLSGADAANYSLTQPAGLKADVTARPIEVTADAKTKVYGNDDPALTYELTDGSLVTGDSLTGDLERAGGETVTGSPYEIKQGTVTAGSNYELTYVPANLTITAKPLTGSFTAADKEYDGTVAAAITGRNVHGAVDEDDVSLSGGTATFATKAVGDGKTVTGTGFNLTGDDKANYTLTSVATTTADITAKPLTGSFTAADKEYDGTTAAAITGRNVHGAVDEDDVSLSGGTASFATKAVGDGKTVSGTGFALAGEDKTNYSLVSSTLQTTADITAKPVTGSFTAADKEYDGTTAATITGRSLHGAVDGDQVDLSGGTASFATKTVGDGKTVTSTGFALAGDDKDNYSLTMKTASASITARPITGSFTAADKVYDGTTAGSISGRSLEGKLEGDQVSLTGGSATFGDKNVGEGKTVTGTGFSLAGDDRGNYSLVSGTLQTMADITPKPLAGSFTAADKVYDGTTAATITGRSLAGVVGTDAVGLAGGTATFASPAVGQGKTVTGTGFQLSGDDKANYALVSSTLTTTASILYGWNGFLQPINDTAHQTGVQQSKFKLGSTVPVKFQVKDVTGSPLQQATLPTFERVVRSSSCDANAALEPTITDPATTGTTFRWDASLQGYIYNWSTKGLAAGVHRISANLADGTKQYVDICLTK